MVFNFLSWFILVASNYLRIWGDEWAKESNEKDPHLQVKAFFFSNQVLLSSHRLDIYSLAGAHFFPATCMNSQATFWPQIRTIQNHLWCICKTVFAFLLSFAKSLFSIFQVSLLVAWAQICAKVSFGHILNVVRSELWGNPAGISNCSPSEVFGVGPLSTLFFLRVCWQGTLCLYQTSCLDLAIWHQKKLDDDGRSRTWEPSERSRRALFPTIHRLGGSDESEVRCPEPLPPAHLLLPLNISEHFWTFSKMLNCIWKSKTKCKNKDKGVLSCFLPPIYSLPPLLLSQLWNFSQNGKKDKSGTRASSSPISYHAMVVPWVAHFAKCLETFELVLSDLTKHSFRCDKSVLWGILRYFLGLWSFSRYSELLLDIS